MSLFALSLVLAVGVVLAVGALLATILRLVRGIEAEAKAIWEAGGRVANNTIHVPDLAHVNTFLERILKRVPTIAQHIERIRAHAETCPGCPKCLVGGRL